MMVGKKSSSALPSTCNLGDHLKRRNVGCRDLLVKTSLPYVSPGAKLTRVAKEPLRDVYCSR